MLLSAFNSRNQITISNYVNQNSENKTIRYFSRNYGGEEGGGRGRGNGTKMAYALAWDKLLWQLNVSMDTGDCGALLILNRSYSEE